MGLLVEIDPQSGFCGGVIRAIGSAERFLSEHPGRTLYSLGSIVHNDEELSRLSRRGLVSVSQEDLPSLAARGELSLLIRAHGEPPSTYRRAAGLGFEVVDCTCPVVLKLQQDIRAAYDRLQTSGRPGQIVIFGRIGHAEVLGLVGQVDGDAIVVEAPDMLRAFLSDGTIRRDGRIELFSQTTKSPEEYAVVASLLRVSLTDPAALTVHDTICTQVARRHENLTAFATQHDVVIFVAGKTSSNGTVLFSLCKSLNIRTFLVSSEAEVRKEWFRPDDKVGVSGATSTPKWLLDQVAGRIASLTL
ncbi:MAG: 4-hydroxy-3-methylbut-2-enyl diphosphate reductase [Bacteroidales bacterium]|nr:4-hydroxy-3-methylbut-2-enyl diphosphate reductase [Bacteroidales bacterium]